MDDRVTLRFLAMPQDSNVGGEIVAAGSVLEWIDQAGDACAVARPRHPHRAVEHADARRVASRRAGRSGTRCSPRSTRMPARRRARRSGFSRNAASWSSGRAVAVYSGGIHFFAAVRIGHLVELDARLIHTGPHSLHVAVHVRSGPATDPQGLAATTQCMSIFVDLGDDGRARPVRPFEVRSAEDRRLDAHAVDLIAARSRLSPLPESLQPGQTR